MGLTILFGDRARKATAREIAERARAVVNGVLARHRLATTGAPQPPVWHSVAMQIELEARADYARLLDAIRYECARSRVDVMGVRLA
ncbi:MAG TPA: hypothetical protein PKO41_00350 [Dokdonella sp.]|uniref:hypothetical protein n=1 Tax=Dokdonella sp. TaxID=2291710 RepID=UPI0025B8BEE7|nr:hypothetical protein [Dokdonella sp.]MBX3691911.1 hypothetical protein [Dokdonella sp.]HNR90849.1 hypothetical protein [Dokdonella sp.]